LTKILILSVYFVPTRSLSFAVGIPTSRLVNVGIVFTLQDQSLASYEAWDCAPAPKVLCAKSTLLLDI